MIRLITDKFNTRIDKYTDEKTSLKKTLNSISTLRLLSFIIILFSTYKYIINDYSKTFLYPTLISFMIFLSLVIYHNKLKRKLKFINSLIKINNNYLDRINGDWINFDDFGEDFIDNTHSYSSDLDIVGLGSLFQRINLSSTWIGRETLAKDLLNPEYNKEEILNRQEAIKELSSKLDFVQHLEYESNKKINKKEPEDIIGFFKENRNFSYSKQNKIVIKLLPYFTLGLTGLAILFELKFLYLPIFIFLILQIILWIIGSNKNNTILERVGLFKDNLEVYLGILEVIKDEDFESVQLKELKTQLFSGEGSIKAIKKLDILSERINLKHTGVLYLLLNMFLLWDYRSVYSLENWYHKHAQDVENWIYSIGEFEALSSLSVLLQIEDNISFPIIEDEKNIISKSVGHPLLDVDERIYNDVNIIDNIFVITGSNMSGKTTFLRSIGINLVLLNAGTVTISEEFKAPIMDIFTSMRITDDLKNKISTFYAELLRIKEILDYSTENNNTLFLIDEIFKGTNSKDRILGAKNVLKNLNNLGLIGAITTHDFELCELDIYPRIENYHFAEDYVDGKISFDYKIKKGRSESTNARYLMELVGIEIID